MFLDRITTMNLKKSIQNGEEGETKKSVFDKHKGNNNITKDSDVTVEVLREVIDDFKAVIKKQTGRDFESDPYSQLKSAIEAVWRSWNCPRAITYRKIIS